MSNSKRDQQLRKYKLIRKLKKLKKKKIILFLSTKGQFNEPIIINNLEQYKNIFDNGNK